MKKITLFMLFLYIGVGYSQKKYQIVLEEIKMKAVQSNSDAVIIKKDGKIIYEDYFGKEEKPIYIASAGKSLTSLAIGKLIDLKFLDSLDQPVHTIYPQWKQGTKRDITVKMLLNHTSGLQNNPNASVELEPAPTSKIHNIIDLALAAELTDGPGEVINYNNKAVALLGGIVEKLSGKRFDHFFVDEFYKPMNIAQYDWIKDESRNPTVHGAFIIKPSDFIKFGELILNKGLYDGKRIISEEWINESLKQGQKFTPMWGLLWWRLPEYEKRIIDDEIFISWEKAGVNKSFLKKIKPMKGILYETKYDFYTALEKVLGKDWNKVLNDVLPSDVSSSNRIYSDKITSYYADGFRGNYLVIVPETKTVAIRCADFVGFNYETDFFPNFVNMVSKLGQ